MSDFGNLSATVRTRSGKGAARSLRREGFIPAVMYGQGQENVSLSVDPREFRRATDPDRGYNSLYQLTLQGDGRADEVVQCVLTDVQLDSVRRDIIHLDFLRVNPEDEVTRLVPVVLTGRAAGVTKGGKLKGFRRHLKIAAKPANLPIRIEIDVTPVEGGEYLRVKDLELENARAVENPEQPLCFVEMPKVRKTEEAEDPKKKKKK